MGNRQKVNTDRTYVNYIATSDYGKTVDSRASERDHLIKQRMVSGFDKMTRRKTNDNKQ